MEFQIDKGTSGSPNSVRFLDHIKSCLMISLMKYIKGCGLTQVEAAKRLGVTQSRMSNLMNHRIDLFSSEMLLDMMERAGFRVYEKIQIDINDFLSHAWPSLKSANRSGSSSR